MTANDLTRTTLGVLFIGILIGACFWILRPFLTSIVWAAIIVVATWPVLLKLQKRLLGRRGLAAAVMTVILLLAVVVPLIGAIVSIIYKAGDIVSEVKSLSAFAVQQPPDWISNIPFAGSKIAQRWHQYASLSPDELSALLSPYAGKVINWFVAQAGSVASIMLQFLLTVILSAVLYARGETVAAAVLGFSRRLAGLHGEKVAILAAQAIRGVALSIVVTALIQTAISGAGLIISDVPAATLLTAVVFIFCLAQIGPFPVLCPSVIWLYWKGDPLWGTVLLVFSIIAMTIDNVIRPILIKKGADLPLIIIFGGVIGGLIAFGVIGLFVGPVVLAVTHTLLKAWVSGGDQEDGSVPRDE